MQDVTNMIQDHRKDVAKKTLTIKELAEALGTSPNKARQLTHAEGFPVMILGKSRLTVISKLDEWLENNIGKLI